MCTKSSSKITVALALAIVHSALAQLQPPRTIILIGPPGSGKTLQADYLRKRYKIPAISMAQLLHEEVNRRSSIGKALAASLSSGELLADGPANDLMMARLLRPDAGRGFILDGYPTTEGQAKALDAWLTEHNLPKPAIIVLEVPEETSRARMVRRRRADDEPANIARRLKDYREAGRLVEQWYGPERILRIEATGTSAEVAQRISGRLDALQSMQELKRRSPEDSGLKRREPELPGPQRNR
jgi:adenylate kinase